MSTEQIKKLLSEYLAIARSNRDEWERREGDESDYKCLAWSRKAAWRQRTMNQSGDRLAIDDFMGQESIDDLVDYVCDEWSGPPEPAESPAPERVAPSIRALAEQLIEAAIDSDASGRPDGALYQHAIALRAALTAAQEGKQ
jgi:hypothetical protein